MPARTFHRRQEWLLRSTPEALWPFVANMHRFNYDSGNPALERLPGARLPNGYHRLRSSVVEFEEQPFEWVRPRYYSSAKRFRKGAGIFAEVRSRAELLPEQAGGTRLIYELWATPSSALGLLAIPLLLRKIFAGFARVVPRYDQAAALAAPSPLPMPARQVRFVPGGRERLRALAGELRGQLD